jgi:hypothetical protein
MAIKPNHPSRESEVDDSKYESKNGYTIVKDVQPPQGENSLGAQDMFLQRKYYKEQIYPNQFIAATPIDMWYDKKKQFFGKVDPEGLAIYADNSKLKQLVSLNDSNIFALDFVADAFEDFKSNFLFLNKNQVAGTPFATLDPQRGARQVLKDYDVWMDEVYTRFSSGFMSEVNNQNSLIDFGSFMGLFKKFVKFNYGEMPVTLSQYIYSPLAAPTISGLMIEVTLDKHGNDFNKYNHFISDKNFLCFANSAQKYGFKIDKNMPGRLIADIKSPAMKKYMDAYPKLPKPFILEPPQTPTPMPPPPPPQVVTEPLEPGDFVEFVVMIPTTRDVSLPNLILRDHSLVQDRYLSPGTKSKIVNDVESGQKKNMLTSLIEYHKGNNGGMVPVLYRGKILETSPTDRLTDQSGYKPYFDPNGEKYYIIDVDQTRPFGNTSNIYVTDENTLGRNHYGISYEKINLSSGRTRRYIRGQLTTDSFAQPVLVIPMEVPADAVHLSATRNETAVRRFIERTTYKQRYEQWEKANDEYYEIWEQTTLRDYNRLYNTWSQKKEQYEIDLEEYESSPRLSTNNVIGKRMIRSSDVDVYLLKQICMQFYHSYVTDHPIVSPTTFTTCKNGTYGTKKLAIYREQITKSIIEQKFNDSYWLDQVIQIRYYETGLKLPKKTLNKYRNQAQLLLKNNGGQEAMLYINKEFRKLLLTT